MRLFPCPFSTSCAARLGSLGDARQKIGNLQDRAGQAEVRAAVAEAQKRVLLQSSVFEGGVQKWV
jgi:hypothetical protein